ncbi:hypothetical protein RugamoR57_03510 [Duganella caerulea]|uniref:hypothetical protein n=1 Tax=Duganella caerulea TaxID=2885762 RepID=UPI0030E8F3BB
MHWILSRSPVFSSNPGQIIAKRGPFELPKLTPEYSYFAHLMRDAIGQISSLPDFSADSQIAIMSDFGGEHSGAHFATYSFLVMAYNKVGPFRHEVEQLRGRHKILSPYSEFAFKDLQYGPRLRALPDFLGLVESKIHGVLVTVAIDKDVPSVFAQTKQQAHELISLTLAKEGFGQWDGATGERVLRICHTIAMLLALVTQSGQRVLWYCDSDAVNAQGKKRNFEHTRQLLVSTLSLYCDHQFDIVGAAVAFKEKSHLDDLLSVADFAAGTVQDMLTAHKTGNDEIAGKDGKVQLLKWMTRQSRFLSKLTIEIGRMPGGEVGSGLVRFDPASSL